MEGIFEYPFLSRYIEIDGLRVHYLDEGSRENVTFLLLHGLPAWSYMYRKIIPILTAKGYRVVCPDLIGFGKSDQLEKASDYTYNRQFSILNSFLKKLNLDSIIIYGQDWGAGFALHLTVENQNQILGCAASNGLLPTNQLKIPPRLKIWQWFAKYSPYIPVGQIVSWGCSHTLPLKVKRNYSRPFQKPRTKIPVRVLPQWIPKSKDDPIIQDHIGIWQKLEQMHTPVLCLFSDKDKFTSGGAEHLIAKIPGCQNQAHQKLRGGHFIQEDAGEELANLLINFANSLNK
ncbi:MAG: alpha/beta fold hydrolase [Bacteroidales bacterium]|nr:alpha/beta fold hydrolase [Bacteroidales bacterium]